MSPKSGDVKFVDTLPSAPGGFGGGHAMDLTPIINALKKRPGTWALLESGRKSLGSLQRLPEFDVEISSRQSTPRTYKGKDGKEKAAFLIDVYGRYVQGYTAQRVKEAEARKAAAKGAPKPAAKAAK